MPYTVASTLDNILTTRKAEQRQAMLDEISKRNVESEITSRDENTKSLADQRSALADEHYLKMIQDSGFDPDQDLSKIDPRMLAVAEKTGYIKHSRLSPTPSVSTSEDFRSATDDPRTQSTYDGPNANEPSFTMPGDTSTTTGSPTEEQGTFFKGTREDQEANRLQTDMQPLIESGFFTDPKVSDIQKMLTINRLFRQKPTTTEFTGLLKPKGNRYVMGMDGKVTQATGPDGTPLGTEDQITPVPRPATAPAPSFSYGGVDPKTGMPISMDNRSGHFRVAPATELPNGIAPKPTAASQGNGLTSADVTLLGKLRAKAVASPGIVSAGAPNPRDVAAFDQVIEGITSKYHASPNVKAAIRDLLYDPNADNSTNQEIVEGHKGDFSDVEAAQFQDLLSIIRVGQ